MQLEMVSSSDLLISANLGSSLEVFLVAVDGMDMVDAREGQESSEDRNVGKHVDLLCRSSDLLNCVLENEATEDLSKPGWPDFRCRQHL